MRRYLYLTGVMIFLSISILAYPENNADKYTVPPIIKSPSSIGEAIFPHKRHFSEFGVSCRTCHHETNATKLKIPHPNYFDDLWVNCSKCHHQEKLPGPEQKCSNCHHPYPSNIADETLSAKVVIHKSCGACHDIGNGSNASKNCKFCHKGAKASL